jgi:transaldolase
VISVFVSRMDRAIDAVLEEKGVQPALAGIYNASEIYSAVKALEVPYCRTLFASTGVKSGGLRPSYYVEELLAPNSVNTAPIATIEAFIDVNDKTPKLPIDDDKIKAHFDRMIEAGIDMEALYARLMREGLEAFKTAFSEILAALE